MLHGKRDFIVISQRERGKKKRKRGRKKGRKGGERETERMEREIRRKEESILLPLKIEERARS